jgi:broad specificity phosphatase PhoE
MPSVVMLLRHAEKPLGGGPPHGVTIDGIQDAESLTPRGWQRAGALVALFAPGAIDGRSPRLSAPTHLFASQVGPQSSSQRPRETLLPLAERLGLSVDSRFRKEEIDQLVQAVRAIDGIVLVAWEHHLIPSIGNMLLGDTSSAPQIWPDDRYDVVWVIEYAGPNSRGGFREVPEMLLAGDQPRPIALPAPT